MRTSVQIEVEIQNISRRIGQLNQLILMLPDHNDPLRIVAVDYRAALKDELLVLGAEFRGR